MDTLNSQIHDYTHSWLGTGISIKIIFFVWFILLVFFSSPKKSKTIKTSVSPHTDISDHYRCWLSCLVPLVLLLQNLYIIWLSNLPVLSVPDEAYSRNASCALNLISTFLLIHLTVIYHTFKMQYTRHGTNGT